MIPRDEIKAEGNQTLRAGSWHQGSLSGSKASPAPALLQAPALDFLQQGWAGAPSTFGSQQSPPAGLQEMGKQGSSEPWSRRRSRAELLLLSQTLPEHPQLTLLPMHCQETQVFFKQQLLAAYNTIRMYSCCIQDAPANPELPKTARGCSLKS